MRTLIRSAHLLLTLAFLLTSALALPAIGQTNPPHAAAAHEVAHPPASPTASPSASPSATPAPTPNEPSKLTQSEVIDYLSEVITWRRGLADLTAFSLAPEEALLAADNRQLADEAVKLAFDFARNATPLVQAQPGLAKKLPPQPEVTDNGTPALADVEGRRDHVMASVAQINAQRRALQAQLAHASRKDRPNISQQLATVQAQLELAQSRLDSLDAMLTFEANAEQQSASPDSFSAQIDELERSVPQLKTAPAARPAAAAVDSSGGILNRLDQLLTLNRKRRTLAAALARNRSLSAAASKLHGILIAILGSIDQRALAQTTRIAATDLATIQQARQDFETLTKRSQTVGAAALPLSKQLVILKLDSANLERWRSTAGQQFNRALRNLALRLGGLGALLLAIFIGAGVWRRLTFRYVQDLQRRYQLLQLRRLIVILAVALVAIFGFANELGSLATVMGFAAAGIALALQNVIISLAGYFYLSGRFGIRVGDRVQISGVNGDVLEIGFFKMTLMELSGDLYGQQPTGRAVIFPNSVVFQPSSNFFRQLPGSNFVWNEIRLTLSPESDYRLAEKRLSEVANEVYARYRDIIQSEYRAMERELNLRIDSPRPQTRLQWTAAGLEIVIRYPARITSSVQTADEIARRLLDSIKREPGLKLVAPSAAALQSVPMPSPATPPAAKAG